MAVLYLCDHQGCAKARELGYCPSINNDCIHTSDIEHALIFCKDEKGNYWEQIQSTYYDRVWHDGKNCEDRKEEEVND